MNSYNFKTKPKRATSVQWDSDSTADRGLRSSLCKACHLNLGFCFVAYRTPKKVNGVREVRNVSYSINLFVLHIAVQETHFLRSLYCLFCCTPQLRRSTIVHEIDDTFILLVLLHVAVSPTNQLTTVQLTVQLTIRSIQLKNSIISV